MNQTRTLPDRWQSRNDHDGLAWSAAVLSGGAIHSGVELDEIPGTDVLRTA